MTATTDAAPPTLRRLRDRVALPVVWANLVGQVVIVGTGGAVRLTGSGLGCSSWPQCEPGEFSPSFHEATSLHPFIEFGNRTLTGVLGILGLLVVLVVVTRRDRARSYRWLGLAPLLGVVAQAVIGGIIVLLDLPPGFVALHLLVSMGLIALSALLVVRTREGDGPPTWLAPATARRLVVPLALVLGVVLAVGTVVTGAGPHSGDDEVGYRFAVDPWLVAKVHAAAVWVFVALQVASLVVLRRARVAGRPWTTALVLLVVTLAQGAVGYVQLFTGLPIALVNLHMVGAAVLTAATVWYATALRERAAVAPVDAAVTSAV